MKSINLLPDASLYLAHGWKTWKDLLQTIIRKMDDVGMMRYKRSDACIIPGNNKLSALQSLANWESENKIHCKQTLVEGNGPKTYWTRELNGDELTLVST